MITVIQNEVENNRLKEVEIQPLENQDDSPVIDLPAVVVKVVDKI